MASGKDQFPKWENLRKRGPAHFVLFWGVAVWGIGTAILWSLLMWLASDLEISQLLPLALVLFPIGGLLWGSFIWWFAERKYKRQISGSDS